MTGFGSPCGACKFLRRKCVRGCVFAPYFCHDQGATHFAAIHKVFGASNVSKLLTHLPVADRLEAAVTITYEAQARLQDPIYGCVSHIFALRQQVVNLQAQLATLRAQAAQNLLNSSTTNPQDELYDKFLSYQQNDHGFFQPNGSTAVETSLSNPSSTIETTLYYDNVPMDQNSMGDYHHSTISEENLSYAANDSYFQPMASCDVQMDSKRWEFQDMEDLQSVAFANFHCR